MKWAFIIIIFFYQLATAQEGDVKKKKWEWNGYLKDLQTFSVDKNFSNLVSGNLLHNRVNMKWKPSEYFTAALELRNRLFWGDEVRRIPDFVRQLKNENELANISVAWARTSNFVLHSNTERLWMEYRKSKWNIRLGRQRINWGITTAWNPNDIFNTYNFLDVDYEERPGVDAARMQYMVSDFSHFEAVFAPGNDKIRSTGAVKYFLNKGGYDFQFLSGIYKGRFTAGGGWAGSIKDAGFKGEMQYFVPHHDSSGHFNFSIESDYTFKKGWYANAGFLFNSEGLTSKINNWNTLSFRFSPLHLMPTKWNFIVAAGKEFTALFSGNMSILFAPGTNLFLLLPSLKYNLKTNLDLDWVWQSFFTTLQGKFQAVNHRTFLRLKWNF